MVWFWIGGDGQGCKTGKVLVSIDEKYYRPAEVELLLGDPSKALKELGWSSKINLQEMISEMVQYDLKYDTIVGMR